MWRQPSIPTHIGCYHLSPDEHSTHYRHCQTLPYNGPSIEPPYSRSMYTDSNISLSFDASSSMHNDFHEISCSVGKFFQARVCDFVHVIHRTVSRARMVPRPITKMFCHQQSMPQCICTPNTMMAPGFRAVLQPLPFNLSPRRKPFLPQSSHSEIQLHVPRWM